MGEPIPAGDRPAKKLAKELLPHLEALANIHYLLDRHVEAPALLAQLRTIEDEAFNAILKIVQAYL